MDILRVFVGLDYHSDSIRVCVMDDQGIVLRNRSVRNSLCAVIEEIQGAAPAMLVQGVAIEACTGSAEFAARLQRSTEWSVKLANAAKVHEYKRSPDKTDKGDAWQLADLIRVNYLPQVWLPDEFTRQLRHMVRYRQSLVADAKDIKLRIRSLLKDEVIAETHQGGAWTKAWREWLTQAPLRKEPRWIIEQQLTLLESLQTKLDEVDEHVTEITKNDADMQKLLVQPNVGPVTALLLRAVIGNFRRFRKGKQLAHYCALSPRNASSGKRQADAGLVQAGHDDLRCVLIQLAKRLPRMDAHWREFKERLGKTKPANVVSAAIANRWLRQLHHIMTSTTVEQPTELAA